jgi:leucine dehydrogenase
VELGRALSEGELTTLRVVRRAGRFDVEIGREWDPELDFADYARAFQVDQLPCAEPLALGDRAARKWIREKDLDAELSFVEGLMRSGQHEMLELFVHARLEMHVAHHIHSSALGANNGFHALRAGGMRRHEPTTSEREVLRDGLNLSRAMSFKCASAGVPFGGSKTTVRCSPFSLDDVGRLGFLAYCIDRGHLITGPDMGFPPELIDVIGELYSHNILCGPGGPLGHTGAPTAFGVVSAMRAAAEHAWGSPSLEYRTVAIQGVGTVGLELAKLLAAERAKLIVSDRDPVRLEAATHRVGGLRVVPPEQILGVECDVLAPCAMGGVLNAETINALACAMIFGSANNQLAAASTDGEVALARQIAERNIVFVPDWTYTMGGLLTGYEEYVYRERASSERLRDAIERAAGDGVRELLEHARQRQLTPTEVAYERVLPIVHPS